MPEDSGAGEKTEEPTPKKRQQAREEGQVAQSPEVATSLLLLIGFVLMIPVGGKLFEAMSVAMVSALRDLAHWDMTDSTSMEALAMQFAPSGLWLLVFSGALAIAAVAVLLLQVGWLPTLKPLIPKFSKVSPLAGLKRLFGLRGLMRFVFSLLKITLIIAVAWFTLSREIPNMVFYRMEVEARFYDELWIFLILGIKLAAVIAFIAIADYLYQRYQQTKDLMMTKQEVKEEYKQSEGDPLVKAKIRQIQRQMAQQRMMQEVPSADVVITNPTHVAVALRYKPEEMDAPICVAKGYDAIAQKIKAIASEHDIPQVENVPLARGLAKTVEIGQAIPFDFYQEVAEVLSYVYKLQGKDITGAA